MTWTVIHIRRWRQASPSIIGSTVYTLRTLRSRGHNGDRAMDGVQIAEVKRCENSAHLVHLSQQKSERRSNDRVKRQICENLMRWDHSFSSEVICLEVEFDHTEADFYRRRHNTPVVVRKLQLPSAPVTYPPRKALLNDAGKHCMMSACMASRIDYCNSVFVVLQRRVCIHSPLQLVLHSVARLTPQGDGSTTASNR